MRLDRLASVLGLAALFACPIEPSGSSVVVPAHDGGTLLRPDAQPTDAQPAIACDDFMPCAGGQRCSRDGVCIASTASCTDNGDCADPDLCVGGACTRPAGTCAADEPGACPDGRCFPNGWCGPTARISGDGLAASCRLSTDCGHTGRCAFGVCAPCTVDSDCPGARECNFDGTCVEPFICRANSDCYPGNGCVSGTCTPSASGCLADPGNDRATGAVPLVEGATITPSICGDDVDWWSFFVAGGRGARVVVRTNPRVNSVAVELEETRDAPGLVTSMVLPGLTVLEVGTSSAGRSFLMKVSRLDTAGPYTIALSRQTSLCAGDVLDLYGDATVADALEVPAGSSLARRACPADVDMVRVAADSGDAWRVSPALFSAGALEFEVARLDGSSAAEVLATGRYTQTTTTALRPRAPAGAETWLLSMRTENVPAAGTDYGVDLTRVRGGRIAACGAAQALTAGVQTISLGGAPDLDAPVACAPAAGVDRLLRIDPPRAGALLHLTARPTSTVTRARVGISMLATCTDDASQGVCDFAPEPSGAASVEAYLGATPVWIALSSTTAVDVAVTVAFDERGDYTCRLRGPTPILASGDLAVDTRAATNTVEASGNACGLATGSGSGPDRFFALDLGAGERAALDLVGPSGGLLWVSTDCERMNSTCVAAATSARGAPGHVLLEAGARAQTYLVAVDGLSDQDGYAMTLRTHLRPACVSDAECVAPLRCDDYACVGEPANDRCEGTLVALVNGQAEVSGSTGAARDDFVSTACSSPSSGQDVVYAVDVPAGTTELRARVVAATWDPILQVRSTCGTSTAELACNDDSGGTLLPDVRVAQPAAGRYFVIVDGYAGAGPFTLELTAR